MKKWISVKDKYPVNHDYVLIVILEDGCYPQARQSYYSSVLKGWGDLNTQLECEYSEEEVSHWMPLPEPPDDRIVNRGQLVEHDSVW